MHKITPLHKICQLSHSDTLHSHITKQGNLYIPKALGGVSVEFKTLDNCIQFKIRPEATNWKKYKYVGNTYTQEYFKDTSIKTIALSLQYNADYLCWVATLYKKGELEINP